MTNTLLEQIIEPFTNCMSREAAQRVVGLRADAATQAHLDALAHKANLGLLTDDEKADYDRHLALIHFVSVLQARARQLLKS